MSTSSCRRRSRAQKRNAKIGRSLPWEDEDNFLRLREVLSQVRSHHGNPGKATPHAALLTDMTMVHLLPKKDNEVACYYPYFSPSRITPSGSPCNVIFSSKSKHGDGGVRDCGTLQCPGGPSHRMAACRQCCLICVFCIRSRGNALVGCSQG